MTLPSVVGQDGPAVMTDDLGPLWQRQRVRFTCRHPASQPRQGIGREGCLRGVLSALHGAPHGGQHRRRAYAAKLGSFCTLGMVLVLLGVSGCGGGTRVIKDGYNARQVTEEPIRFLHSTRSWDTTCRWDQLIMDKQGDWFCPPEENYKTHVAQIPQVAPAKSDAVISAAIHGLFFVGGMSALGALMPAQQVTQSVGGQTIRTSTVCTDCTTPGGVAP